MAIQIAEGTVPTEEDGYTPPADEAPGTSDEQMTGWFDADYPHSTKDHPYGFFPLPSGEPDFDKPRKRRPHSRTSSSFPTVARSAQADKTAQTAAKFLCRINKLVGMAVGSYGLKQTASQLKEANEVFEVMAYEALQSDPELAKKILSAGASSGRAQLTMAYVMLAGSLAPTAASEFKANRLANMEEVTS